MKLKVLAEEGQNGHQSAFTLIELLVVIGIIGILAGLLLPALAKAKDRGRGIACVNNTREMGTGITLYVQDYEYYPPGREAGITQWDLCVGAYAGGKHNLVSPEARTALFACPSATRRNDGLRLNYAGNPNVLREVTATSGPAKPEDLKRPTETIVVADAVQYLPDGSSHAILWGVLGSNDSAVYWNNGEPANGDAPIKLGEDVDRDFPTMDPNGANLRYRHGSGRVTGLFADGHIERVKKGEVRDKHFYTNY